MLGRSDTKGRHGIRAVYRSSDDVDEVRIAEKTTVMRCNVYFEFGKLFGINNPVESKDSDAHQSPDRGRIVPYTEAKKSILYRGPRVFDSLPSALDGGHESFGVQTKTRQLAGQHIRSAHS
jgi:hypothetical protein